MTLKSHAKFEEKLTCCFFCPKQKMYELKIYKLCVMTMKNDTKTEEELTCRFKIVMRNLAKFDPNT